MQNRDELLAAVDRAMSALEIIRRYLVQSPEEAPDETQSALPEPEPLPLPPLPENPAPAVPLGPEGEALPLYSTALRMADAAALAARRCGQWQYRDVPELPVDLNLLLNTCREEDRKHPVPAPGCWYVVSPGGAIGAAREDGAAVDWLFLAAGTEPEVLPASFGTAPAPAPESEPEPEPVSEPDPEPASKPEPEPVSEPEPESDPASQPAPGPRFCRSCGAPLRENARFCTACGQKVGP